MEAIIGVGFFGEGKGVGRDIICGAHVFTEALDEGLHAGNV